MDRRTVLKWLGVAPVARVVHGPDESYAIGPKAVVKRFPVVTIPLFASMKDIDGAKKFVAEMAEKGETGLLLPDGFKFRWSDEDEVETKISQRRRHVGV
jgi:hypothetical protein